MANPVAPVEKRRRRLDGLQEGDAILVQSPSGICEQGIFLRLEDNFLVWARNISGTTYIAVTSLDAISITKV
ncbi:hypothetical protein KHQ81_09985 [Mycoplasmatota bacterium]|nr:hypothetical protein KHQ81_09985 [Mycoplasmatota bacterium]